MIEGDAECKYAPFRTVASNRPPTTPLQSEMAMAKTRYDTDTFAITLVAKNYATKIMLLYV